MQAAQCWNCFDSLIRKDSIAGVLLTEGKGAYAAEFVQCCGAAIRAAAADEVEVVRRRPKAPAIDRTTQFLPKGSTLRGNVDLQQGYLEIAGDRSSINIDNEMFTEPPLPAEGPSARPASTYDGFGAFDADGRPTSYISSV